MDVVKEGTRESNCATLLFSGGGLNELCFNHHLANNRRDRDPAACDGPDGAKILSGAAGFGRAAFNAHGCLTRSFFHRVCLPKCRGA